jgi:hypothetical protein
MAATRKGTHTSRHIGTSKQGAQASKSPKGEYTVNKRDSNKQTETDTYVGCLVGAQAQANYKLRIRANILIHGAPR